MPRDHHTPAALGRRSASPQRAQRCARALLALALSGCGASGGPAPSSAPSAEIAPRSETVPAPDRDREIAELLSRAELVVVGRVSLGVCLDGCIGHIEIDEVLAGSASGTIDFISEPPVHPTASDQPRIMFLVREGEGHRWRLLLTADRDLGLAPSHRRRVDAIRSRRGSNSPRVVEATAKHR